VVSTLWAVSAGLAGAQEPAAEQGESRWLRNIRQVTFARMGLKKAGEAYFSPDGKRICFQGVPEGKTDYQIYVMNVDGSGLKMVSTGRGATTCAFFHPSGKRMIFAANHHDQRPSAQPPGEIKKKAAQAGKRNYRWSFYPGLEIYEYTFAGGALRRLTDSDGYDAECAYSPDGKLIVFASMRDGDQEIYICDAEGKDARRITRVKGYDGGPFFSPDGKRIVYRSDREGNGNMQIFTNNLEGTDEQPLTGKDALHWCPFWHPSAEWLVYTHADHSVPRKINYDLYLLKADGSQNLRITTERASDVLPVFSPDGRKLMWTSKRGGLDQAQVFIADFVGLNASGRLRGGS
jgi:Tol biopolymer transport system component